MPNLGHTMESGKVVEWLKPVGAAVARGDLLAVVESDKVSMEVEAPVAGTVLAHLAELQAELPVGATIALIGEPGETVEAAVPSPGTAKPETAAAPAHEPRGPSTATTPGTPRRALASPLARSVAERLGVSLDRLTGTGPDGLIVRADVERVDGNDGAGRVVKLAGTRKRIAERMTRAWREIPMVPLVRELDVTALAASRAGVSWTALFARAAATTLVRHPRLNAWFRGDAIHERRDVDLAVAVALADDIAVPVLRAAHRRPLGDLASELDALIAAARSGALSGQAQVDATFTLSNLGALGIDSFQPIVDPPQVAILGLGRVRPQGDRRIVSATLVFDHRALDGADGARFLDDLSRALDAPDALFS
jgi:pyruvate dehydrogenase E2 component (dihydrolipoamide acetyltransferase)